MAAGVSLMGILILGLGGIVVVVGVIALFGRGRGNRTEGSQPIAAGMTLNCPHCGTETDATRSKCKSCGADL
jgi:hypothetical protein